MAHSALARRACVLVSLLVAGCDAQPSQRLVATGQLLDAQGEPVPNAPIETYELTFVLAGDVEIARTFAGDIDTRTPGIVTDERGMFRIAAEDLELSYDYDQDEYECEDVCLQTETYCYDVEEDVCVEYCDVVTYDECHDECYDDGCTTSCYDEEVCTTYTDDDGSSYEECVTETVCDDECTETCDTVCGPVTEQDCWDDCHVEVYEQCDDECVESEEQCGWVTHTYTAYPELSEVIATRATITVAEHDGDRILAGDEIEAREDQECAQRATSCTPLGVWLQRDSFTLPADDDVTGD